MEPFFVNICIHHGFLTAVVLKKSNDIVGSNVIRITYDSVGRSGSIPLQ